MCPMPAEHQHQLVEVEKLLVNFSRGITLGQKLTLIKSNSIVFRVVIRKAEVKDTNSIVKRLEHRLFLAEKETCVWGSVAGLSGIHGEKKKVKTYWPEKRVRDAWVTSE